MAMIPRQAGRKAAAGVYRALARRGRGAAFSACFTPRAEQSRERKEAYGMQRLQVRRALRISGLVLTFALAGCVSVPEPPEPTPEAPMVVPPPLATRGEFTLEADKLDTWNAVGQILVNTPGVEYEGRSQMLDLYTVRYRGEEFLILTKALLLSDTIRKTTTRVTATTQDGKPIDSNAAADLLAQLQQKLPDEIVSVRAKQAAEAKAKRAAAAKAKAKSKGKAKGKKKKH
jgi:hypothetical protein